MSDSSSDSGSRQDTSDPDRDDEPTTGPKRQTDEETQEDAGLTGGGAHTPAGEPAEPEAGESDES